MSRSGYDDEGDFGLWRGTVLAAIRGKRGQAFLREMKTAMDAMARFQPGMSWQNWGEWHLDHIRPLASFNLSDRTQFLQAVHFSNYQPLWAIDNLRKGASHG
jgi:hypothetical protein